MWESLYPLIDRLFDWGIYLKYRSIEILNQWIPELATIGGDGVLESEDIDEYGEVFYDCSSSPAFQWRIKIVRESREICTSHLRPATIYHRDLLNEYGHLIDFDHLTRIYIHHDRYVHVQPWTIEGVCRWPLYPSDDLETCLRHDISSLKLNGEPIDMSAVLPYAGPKGNFYQDIVPLRARDIVELGMKKNDQLTIETDLGFTYTYEPDHPIVYRDFI